jgi:hypothetical protein
MECVGETVATIAFLDRYRSVDFFGWIEKSGEPEYAYGKVAPCGDVSRRFAKHVASPSS